MPQLRFAVIGAGRMGVFHARKLAAMADVQLVAVADPRQENACELARQVQTKAVADYREIVSRIDAAVVAVPSLLHGRITKELLSAGVHVLVEKPLCPTKCEADELTATARHRGLVLQTGHVERFNPAFAAVRRHFEAPLMISARRESPYSFRSLDVGVVFDLMIHDLDLVLQLAGGPVRQIDALGLAVVGPHEDVAEARITFENGCTVLLTASRVAREAVRRMNIWQADRFATVDFAARTASLVRPKQIATAGIPLNSTSPIELEQRKSQWLAEILPTEELAFEPFDALTLELRHFIDTINSPSKQPPIHETGPQAVALAEQIVAKIAKHAWDDQIDGAVGPLLHPAVAMVREPHFSAEVDRRLRKAG